MLWKRPSEYISFIYRFGRCEKDLLSRKFKGVLVSIKKNEVPFSQNQRRKSMSPRENKPGTTFPGGRSAGRSRSATLEPLRAGKGPSGAIAENVISAFFEAIAGSHPAVPRTISGSLRFDLENGNRIEHWRVTFAKGAVLAERSNAAADCVVRTDKTTMEAIIQGRVNAMAALLRGGIKVEGQALLLALFRGLMTAPAARTESKRVGKMSGSRS
jgi:putative sterol carrier protein